MLDVGERGRGVYEDLGFADLYIFVRGRVVGRRMGCVICTRRKGFVSTCCC